jgi:DNA-binding transcriptional MerR regulator
MRGYTVSEVAKLSGVSVRALHHYDALGLLKPACVGANGYRYYGEDELLRLQQILFHRELGFALEEIAKVLDAAEFDRAAALRAHRARLAGEARRYRRLMRTIDETLAALEGATTMDETKMYQGFDPEKQARHEAELIERFGSGVKPAIDHARQVAASTTQAQFDASQAAFGEIEDGLATALKTGAPADSAHVQDLVRRLHGWVARWWKSPPNRAQFENLGAFYVDHPEFRARYEAKAAGLAEYLAAAMSVFAARELS